MTKILKTFSHNIDRRIIKEAVDVLKNDGVIIYPTDTVYALGCDIYSNNALKRISQIKGINLKKTYLSFLCSDVADFSNYTQQMDKNVFKIIKRGSPGPFTFVLNSSNKLPPLFRSKKTIGIRIPDNNIPLEIVKGLGSPIVSTSVYDDDRIIEYTTIPEIIYHNFKNKVDLVIDGGVGGNVASTIVDLTKGEIDVIRQGKGDVDLLR